MSWAWCWWTCQQIWFDLRINWSCKTTQVKGDVETWWTDKYNVWDMICDLGISYGNSHKLQKKTSHSWTWAVLRKTHIHTEKRKYISTEMPRVMNPTTERFEMWDSSQKKKKTEKDRKIPLQTHHWENSIQHLLF